MATRIFSRVVKPVLINQQLSVVSNQCQQLRFKGHSKWQNIKHTKEAKDAAYNKICSRYGMLIGVSIRENNNDTDPSRNKALAKIIAEAKSMGVTNQTIENSIKNSQISTDVVGLFEIRAHSRISIIAEAVGKNKGYMQTAINTVLRKHGGIVEPGLLKMFNKRGVITVAKQNVTFAQTEDDAIEVGAEDVEEEEDHYTFITSPETFPEVLRKIKEKNYEVAHSEVEYVPNLYVEPASKRDRALFMLLVEALEKNPCVISLHHNAAL